MWTSRCCSTKAWRERIISTSPPALSEELERSAPRIDLVVLNEAPPALRHRVLLDGILLLERPHGNGSTSRCGPSGRLWISNTSPTSMIARSSNALPEAGLGLDREVVAARLAVLDENLRILEDFARLDLSSYLADPRDG